MSGVLLATDGSEEAQRAEVRAIDVARERDLSLHVLCVVDRMDLGEPALSSGELAVIQAEDRGYRCTAAIADRARATGVDVVTEVCHGVPADEIVAYADEMDADAIVLGEHGDHRHHLGGVGRRVRRTCDRETLVVPAVA